MAESPSGAIPTERTHHVNGELISAELPVLVGSMADLYMNVAVAAAAPPTVTVVIPTLNEAANIGIVMSRIPAWVDEVIVVDGHSTDGTCDVVRACRPDVVVMTQDGKGKGDALSCAFQAATGEIIVMLDADGSTDPGEIPRFVAALRTGADFAKGTRFVTGGGSLDISPARRLGNWGLNFLVNRLWGARYTDLCYGYNAFWRRHLPKLHIDSSGFEVETLLNIKAIRADLAIVEVPSLEGLRLSGTSNLSAIRDGMRVLRTIIAERVRPH
jgi:glycosyltransferase involved in cell wall biosynthesis